MVGNGRGVSRWADMGFRCFLDAKVILLWFHLLRSCRTDFDNAEVSSTGRELYVGVSTLSLAGGGCVAASRASNSLTSACLLLVIRTAFHFPDVEKLSLTHLSLAL